MSARRLKAIDRRRFLQLSAALAPSVAWLAHAAAEEPGDAPSPRATSGDSHEPDWNERLSITVGPDKADLVGTSDKVLQAAVDYVARAGGGTVHVQLGTFRLRNAIYLPSRVRILGSGAESILIKEPSAATKLSADSDWFDQEITLVDPSGFRVGDGICLRARNPHNGGTSVCKRTLVARSGNRFKLDRALRENFWLQGESTVATLFPIFSGENIGDVVIENITLDGNRANNENLDGNYAGCVFLQDCNRVTMRGVTARNYNGDGLSWQICHDVTVEDCHSHDHAGLGLHPGSGSQRPVMRRNRLENNDIGIFFCWGVKGGLAEGNKIVSNRSYGVSIGHRDTNNIVRDNDIERSGKAGVLFRPERGRDFAPHRNRLERNRIIDSGPADGIAVDVQGQTESITISANDIRETREPMSRIGVRIGAETSDVRLSDNRIEGFANSVADLREKRG
jgi:hypothetical protein